MRSRALTALSRESIARSRELIRDSNCLVGRAFPDFDVPAESLSDEEMLQVLEAQQASDEQREIDWEVRQTGKRGSRWRQRPPS